MKLEIRNLRREDVPALLCIEKETFTVPWSEENFEALLTRDYCLYLTVSADGEVIGCAGLTVLGDEGDIDKVMVSAPYRGKGIGYRLVSALIEAGEARGIRDFTLEVRCGNEPAIALYQKLGFRSAGIRPNFYEKPVEDAVIMWRYQKKEH